MFSVALKLRLSTQDVMGASVYQAGEEMLQVDLYKVHLAATSPL